MRRRFASFGAGATVWLITLPQAALVLVTTVAGYLRDIEAPKAVM